MAKIINEFVITIGGNRTIAEILAKSDHASYNHSIIKQCALAPGPKRKAMIVILGIEEYYHDPTETEIQEEYVRHGLKYLTVDHVIHFFNQKPDLPTEEHPIISYLRDPILGNPTVMVLVRGRGCSYVYRNLDLNCFGPNFRYSRNYRFAGIRE